MQNIWTMQMRDMQEICKKYSRNIQEICKKYSRNIQEICTICKWICTIWKKIANRCKKYAKNMHRVGKKYARNMQRAKAICSIFNMQINKVIQEICKTWAVKYALYAIWHQYAKYARGTLLMGPGCSGHASASAEGLWPWLPVPPRWLWHLPPFESVHRLGMPPADYFDEIVVYSGLLWKTSLACMAPDRTEPRQASLPATDSEPVLTVRPQAQRPHLSAAEASAGWLGHAMMVGSVRAAAPGGQASGKLVPYDIV